MGVRDVRRPEAVRAVRRGRWYPGLHVLCFCVGIASGCTGEGRPSEGELAAGTADCVTGLWMLDAFDGFPCACRIPSLASPECDESHCAESEVRLFREDGLAFIFNARWSESSRTVSVSGGCGHILERQWEVNDNGEIVLRSDPMDDWSSGIETLCADGYLQTVGYQDWTPPLDEGLETTLASVPDRADCIALEY